MASAAMVQHGGEVYLVSDIKRGLAEKLAQTADPKYLPGSEYWNAAIEKAEKLKDVRRNNHLSGKETTIEIGPDRIFKKRKIDGLPHVDFDGTVDGTSQLPEFSSDTQPRTQRLIEGMGYDLRTLGKGGYGKFLTTVGERMEAQIELHAKQLRAEFPDVGITTQDFQTSTAGELVDSVLAEPIGLNITPTDIDAAGAEGEGSMAVTTELILDKLREAVGEAGLSDFTVTEKVDGSFKVLSRKAVELPFDVSDDQTASPLDALIVINTLNEVGSHAISIAWPSADELRKDVNADGFIAPIDVLLIVNFINERRPSTNAEGELVAIYVDANFDGSQLNTSITRNAPAMEQLPATAASQLFSFTGYVDSQSPASDQVDAIMEHDLTELDPLLEAVGALLMTDLD